MNFCNTFLVLITVLFLIGCKQKNTESAPSDLSDILNDPPATFAFYERQPLEKIDSVYGVIFKSLSDSEKYDLLEKHLKLYEKTADNRTYFEANTSLSKGWLYINEIHYDSAVFFFNKAATLYLKAEEKENAAYSYWGKGVGYFYLAEYGKSLTAHYKSLEIYESLKDSLKINQVKTSIASTLIRENEYDRSLELCESVLPYYISRKDYNNVSYVHSLLFQIFYYQGKYTEALKYANLSLDESLKTDNLLGIGASYNNLASIYMDLKNWKDALTAYEQSKHWVEKSGNRNQTVILELNIAKCLWYLGDDKKAESIVLSVIDSVKVTNQKNILAHSYDMLYKFEKEAGNYQQALDYYELQNGVRDSIFSDEKHKIIQELNVRYASSEKEHKIQQMKAEQQAGYTHKVILVLTLVIIVVLGGLVILFLAGKNKRQQLAVRNKQLEIEGYQKDLAAFAERILHKNRLIEDLQQRNTIVSESGIITANDQEAESINQLYHLKILTDADWLQFKQLFDRAFPGMIAKLRNHWSDITAAEERSFLLIKLNISNKESADMLGISLQSIKKNRYRLKKRFGLSEEQDLDEFVKGFG